MSSGTQEKTSIMGSHRLRSAAVHILFLGIIFILPEAMLRVAIPNRTLMISWPMYAKSCITIGVFYLNYFIIIPSTLIRKRRCWNFALWNVVVIVAGCLIIWIIYQFLYTGPRNLPRIPLATMSYILRDSVMLLLAAVLAMALRLSMKWDEIEHQHQKMMAVRKSTELESLRSQLNPHFLFNTLSSIYALIAIDADRAQKAVHQLSNLLRYVVYDNPLEVPVDHEVKFVENYVELMRLRMGERPVELIIRRSNDEFTTIAPLLFVTLVENAFKHGNCADHSQPIIIRIDSDGRSISCRTENFTDKVPKTSEAPPVSAEARRGVGLGNLRRRLELIYGANATLSTALTSDGKYVANLTISPVVSNKINS